MNFNKLKHPLASALESISFSAIKYADDDSFLLRHQANIETPTSFTNSCLKRKCEFIAGRLCARAALETNHIRDFQILSETDRSPVWPENFTGSITHSQNFAAAAIASKSVAQGIGIDTEVPITAKRLESIKSRLFLRQELNAGQEKNDPEIYYSLIFSAKESIFKCIYPLTGVFFGFHDALVSQINWNQQTFQYQLTKGLGPHYPAGKTGTGFFKIENLIHTAVIEWS
ncbi:MAG: 4'-phosphopantetheinyl transferase [Oligoflexales bacterium]